MFTVTAYSTLKYPGVDIYANNLTQELYVLEVSGQISNPINFRASIL